MLVDSVAILPDDEAKRRHALTTLAAAKSMREPFGCGCGVKPILGGRTG
jgi:hypothetical protein